jgi:hypothetical protein
MKTIQYNESIGKYLSEEKLITLHDSIGFLNDYKIDLYGKEFINSDNEVGFVTVKDKNEEIHWGKTQALTLLAACNAERQHLIDILTNKK